MCNPRTVKECIADRLREAWLRRYREATGVPESDWLCWLHVAEEVLKWDAERINWEEVASAAIKAAKERDQENPPQGIHVTYYEPGSSK